MHIHIHLIIVMHFVNRYIYVQMSGSNICNKVLTGTMCLGSTYAKHAEATKSHHRRSRRIGKLVANISTKAVHWPWQSVNRGHTQPQVDDNKGPKQAHVTWRRVHRIAEQKNITRRSRRQPLGKTVVSSYYPLIEHTYSSGKTEEIAWSSPNPRREKLSVDGPFLNGSGGTGMILRDSADAVIFSSCRQLLLCNDALESELLAISEGLSLALQWSSLPIDVESGCTEPVAMLNSHTSNKSKYFAQKKKSNKSKYVFSTWRDQREDEGT